MKIAVLGCGGIGSNVIEMLIRAGINCEILLIDFDIVEESNLNRQFFFNSQIGKSKAEELKINLLNINKSLNINTLTTKIEKENIHTITDYYNVIIEGFDRVEYKKLLIEELGNNNEKIIVSACGVAGYNTKSITYRKTGNTHIFGDFITSFECGILYTPKIRIVAAMMADKIFKHIKGITE